MQGSIVEDLAQNAELFAVECQCTGKQFVDQGWHQCRDRLCQMTDETGSVISRSDAVQIAYRRRIPSMIGPFVHRYYISAVVKVVGIDLHGEMIRSFVATGQVLHRTK